jgi:spore coat protein JB
MIGGTNMNEKNHDTNAYQGNLPSTAPLANAFVPFQKDKPPMYDARKGWIRGTIFPGLDLPLMGMVNKKEKRMTPLTELQTMAFVIQELALYLDTHPDDQETLQLYQAYQKMYHQAVDEYTEKCGPMNHMEPTEGNYRWLDDPWPWEFSANKEG